MNNFSQKDLVELLIKKANGYYYTEEQFEYEKTQNKSNKSEKHIHNISFFDNFDRGQIQNKTPDDTIKSSNEIKNKEETDNNLTLIKKKVATHYVSPDINAIKILFEIFENKVGENNIESLTDEDLINIKNNLLKELSDDITKNLQTD